METLVAMGKKIQAMREQRGLTQEQLEEITGVNTKYISAIERGRKNATVKTLEKIAKGLNIELYELFLLPGELKPEKAVKKAIEAIIKESDLKTLNMCLDFLKKSMS